MPLLHSSSCSRLPTTTVLFKALLFQLLFLSLSGQISCHYYCCPFHSNSNTARRDTDVDDDRFAVLPTNQPSVSTPSSSGHFTWPTDHWLYALTALVCEQTSLFRLKTTSSTAEQNCGTSTSLPLRSTSTPGCLKTTKNHCCTSNLINFHPDSLSPWTIRQSSLRFRHQQEFLSNTFLVISCPNKKGWLF